MALFTSLAALSQTPGSNAPDGSTDAPSTIDDQMRLLASFAALLRDGAHQWVTSVSGTNTITGTCAGVSSLVAGQTFKFVAAGANTGATTLNVNSLGAKTVYKNAATALSAGDIKSGAVVTVTYDGTNFQLTGVASVSSSLGPNGWRQAPGDFMVQWGTATAGQSNAAFSNSFPTPFPIACYVVIPVHFGTDSSVNVCTDSTNQPTTTVFRLRSNFSASAVTCMYIAVGS